MSKHKAPSATETNEKLVDHTPLTAEEIAAQEAENARVLAEAHSIANEKDANISSDSTEPTKDDQDRIRQETQDAQAALISANKAPDAPDVAVEETLDGDQLLQNQEVGGSQKLNEDGLVPGAQVDFATIQKIERSKSPEEQAKLAKNLQTPMRK